MKNILWNPKINGKERINSKNNSQDLPSEIILQKQSRRIEIKSQIIFEELFLMPMGDLDSRRHFLFPEIIFHNFWSNSPMLTLISSEIFWKFISYLLLQRQSQRHIKYSNFELNF